MQIKIFDVLGVRKEKTYYVTIYFKKTEVQMCDVIALNALDLGTLQ